MRLLEKKRVTFTVLDLIELLVGRIVIFTAITYAVIVFLVKILQCILLIYTTYKLAFILMLACLSLLVGAFCILFFTKVNILGNIATHRRIQKQKKHKRGYRR